MSRSNPTLTNPATRFFEWKGSTGSLVFYDKEKKENVTVPLPFRFLVLDELATITGYSKPEQSGFWSNEVRSTVKDDLTVRTKAGVKYTGKYKNEQGIVQMPKGAEYAKSIYLIYHTKQGWEIGNFKASGSARSAWFDFSATCKVQNGTVTITRGEAQEAQTGQFFPPVFKYESSTPTENDEAIRLDRELQIYLNQYLSAPKDDTPVINDDTDQDIGIATPEQVEDFEERKRTGALSPRDPMDTVADNNPMNADTIYPVDELEPINVDDIPF